MIKYLRLASDLHLEAFSGPIKKLFDFFLPTDEKDVESLLVLAGDISSHSEQLCDFLAMSCARFERVYFVAGNHEFYKHDYDAYPAKLRLTLDSMYLSNLTYSLGRLAYDEYENPHVRFIIAPLWADGGEHNTVDRCLNDFRLITRGARRFTVQDMVSEHESQKKTIVERLKEPFDGKTVVITHHLPSRGLVAARFWPHDGSDGANGGFVGDCNDVLASDYAPAIWIHGHTHDTIDTTLWDTRIVCNPAGYRGEWATAHNGFMHSKRVVPKFIEL